MKKDILFPKVEGVSICIVNENHTTNQPAVWDVYLINENRHALDKVLISSKGYNNEIPNTKSCSSILRHFIGTVKARSFVKVEPIIEEVFVLHNEYFLSYYFNNILFDKKYVFLAESIQDKNFTDIPIINKKGVWIK